ncbi:MAG: cytochrome c biogenesis protein CcsA [Prevotella sp.]|nr:cytochrome c biogenesis protein CcsA [Prevotella sp.]
MTKIIIIALYTLIVVCIGFATIIEKYHGTAFVSEHIYGAWWFSALWAVLTVAACAYMLKQHLYRRMAVFLLHASFVVILAGALVTHLFAKQGTVRLRTGIAEINYVDKEGKVERFPFSLTLKEFRIVNYPGTDAPLDYQSVVEHSRTDVPTPSNVPWRGVRDEAVLVSMNNVGNIDGYRLFQQSYDTDGEGVTLGVSYDPWGIAITYTGYLLLLIGIFATLLSRKTQMRALYRKAVLMIMLLVSIHVSAENSQFSARPNGTLAEPVGARILNSQFVLDKDIAHRMGTIQVLYNNRICPLNTVATDFVMKMTGSASWHGYSADEVFFSWMIYYSPWEKELLLNNKRKGADERNAVAEMFYNGQFTKIFPYKLTSDPSPSNHSPLLGRGVGGEVIWFSPGSQILPREIPVKEQFFIKQSMDFLTEAIVTGQKDRAFEIIAKIKLFQRDMIGDLLPSESTTKAELFYNSLRSQKWPVFLSLTLSILLCVLMLMSVKGKWLRLLNLSFVTLLMAYVTLQLGLRWWLSGHIPVSNGPETMLFMAWVLLLFSLSTLNSKLSTIITAFAPLISSFCLLVAMLGGSSSQISPLMPVLQSPLLSVHVMTVMCAYALFALQLLLGIYALLGHRFSLFTIHFSLERATALSQLLLYPAVFLLTIGIFLGAVWANVSWGNYWSWDPKETWALITLMVYAVPFHSTSIPMFRRPHVYHLYMVCAFLSVVITYFGVNYLLGGMHSYA